MEKEFIPYTEALALKELGFDEPCFTYYFCNGILSDTPRESGDDIKYQGDCKFDNHQNSYLEEDDDCSAPTYSQAFRWFREKYNLHVLFPMLGANLISFEIKSFGNKNGNCVQNVYDGIVYDNLYYQPEEAELACLKKLIEIVKK